MTIEVKVPVLPESVSDATIATWHKKAGDAVKRDENLVDLETDKVVLEGPSPVDGVLKEIKFAEGATVNSQQIIAVVEAGGVVEAGAVAAAPAPAALNQRAHHRHEIDDAKDPPAAVAGRATTQHAAPLRPAQDDRREETPGYCPRRRAQQGRKGLDHSVPSIFSTRVPPASTKPALANASPRAASAVSTRISAR